MRLIELVDKLLHGVPFLPERLQDTCLDRLWKWIERLAEGW